MIRVFYKYTMCGYTDMVTNNSEEAEDNFYEMINYGVLDFSADEVVDGPRVVKLENLNEEE